MLLKNIFLDRDGTIIKDKNYLSNPSDVELLPGAGEGLNLLFEANYNLFIVTNQSGIGRNFFTTEEFTTCQNRLFVLLKEFKVNITDTAFCPHSPEVNCTCRKSGVGMWQKLATKHHLLPEESIMIGDKISDIDFGKNAKFNSSVLVLTGYGCTDLKQLDIPLNFTVYKEFTTQSYPKLIAENLKIAAEWIINRKNY